MPGWLALMKSVNKVFNWWIVLVLAASVGGWGGSVVEVWLPVNTLSVHKAADVGKQGGRGGSRIRVPCTPGSDTHAACTARDCTVHRQSWRCILHNKPLDGGGGGGRVLKQQVVRYCSPNSNLIPPKKQVDDMKRAKSRHFVTRLPAPSNQHTLHNEAEAVRTPCTGAGETDR